MKKFTIMITTTALAVALASGCSVKQTEEARLPDVEVQADSGKIPKYEVKKTQEGKMPSVNVDMKDGGNLPKYDVETATVEVSTEKETVKVPKPKVVVEEAAM